MKMHALLFLALIAVTVPRFNRNDWGFVGQLSGKDDYSYWTHEGFVYSDLPRDVAQYLQYVEYFRGEKKDPPLAPFSYRPGVPFLASLLPLEPMSAINVVNVVILGVGLILFRLALVRLGADYRQSFAGCFVAVLSFPTFYYTTVGFVDGALMGVLFGGMAVVSRNTPISLLALALVGILVKETAVILVPVAVTQELQQGASHLVKNNSRRRTGVGRMTVVVLGSLFLVCCYVLLRRIAPGESHYFWAPSGSVLLGNLVNVRMYITLVLTITIPGMLAYNGVRRMKLSGKRFDHLLPLAVGASMSVLLFLYSLLSAHADGRLLWTAYPFLIAMGLPIFPVRMPNRI